MADFTYDDAPPRWSDPMDLSLVYYLGGPMTGYPEFNFPAFAHAKEVLNNTGIKVLSAHEINHGEHTGTGTQPHSEYLRTDLIHLCQCNGLILLKGWPHSKGARLELDVALALEFPIWFYDEYRLIYMGDKHEN
jgi:hypothetical protein